MDIIRIFADSAVIDMVWCKNEMYLNEWKLHNEHHKTQFSFKAQTVKSMYEIFFGWRTLIADCFLV